MSIGLTHDRNSAKKMLPLPARAMAEGWGLAMHAAWQLRYPGQAMLITRQGRPFPCLGCSNLPCLPLTLKSAFVASVSSESAPLGASVQISFLLQVTQSGFCVCPPIPLSSIPQQTAGADTILLSPSSPISAQHGSQNTHSLAHSWPPTREGSYALQMPSAGGDPAWQAREEAIWCGGRGRDG